METQALFYPVKFQDVPTMARTSVTSDQFVFYSLVARLKMLDLVRGKYVLDTRYIKASIRESILI